MTNTHPFRRERVRLDGPGALIAAVPHLLGFHPQESIVAVGLSGAPPQVRLCVRADLPPPDEESATISGVADHLRRAGSDSAVLLVYGSDRRRATSPAF